MEHRLTPIGVGVQYPHVDEGDEPQGDPLLVFIDGIVTPGGPLQTGSVAVQLNEEQRALVVEALTDPRAYIERVKEQQAAESARSKVLLPNVAKVAPGGRMQ